MSLINKQDVTFENQISTSLQNILFLLYFTRLLFQGSYLLFIYAMTE